MDIHTQLEYLIWADNRIFEVLSNLSTEQLNQSFYTEPLSIHHKLLHLAEEYCGWFTDITHQDASTELTEMSHKDASQLMDTIQLYHKTWKEYIAAPSQQKFEIDEGGGLVVPITLTEVIYNLVNHATYHRGQIVAILRMLDIQTPITDYYWYRIDGLNL